LVVGSLAMLWGLGQIWAINTRVTRLEERLPKPIAEELAPIKEKLAEISGRLHGLEARVGTLPGPAPTTRRP
jgi:hypothetical protein